jgi:hypothetical protein
MEERHQPLLERLPSADSTSNQPVEGETKDFEQRQHP